MINWNIFHICILFHVYVVSFSYETYLLHEKKKFIIDLSFLTLSKANFWLYVIVKSSSKMELSWQRTAETATSKIST